jgi:hypothetical protein
MLLMPERTDPKKNPAHAVITTIVVTLTLKSTW